MLGAFNMIKPRTFTTSDLDLETAIELLENLLGASSDLEIFEYDQTSAQAFLDLYYKHQQE
jgi:hypothetical protein